MVGGELSYFRGSNLLFVNGSPFEIRAFSNYGISQITRYYIGTGRFAPFMSLENLFQLATFQGISDPDFGYQLKPGIGMNYFLRSNIALEAVLTTNLINQGDFSDSDNFLFFDLGLKLFFTNKFFAKGTALPERILKKGNIISTTRLNFTKSLEGSKLGLLTSSPNIRYFLTDRFNIFGSYMRQRRTTTSPFSGDKDVFNVLGLSLGASYYLRLTDQMFWNFDVRNSISMQGEGLSDVFDKGVNTISTSISTSIHYFSGSAKFYGGIGYIDSRVKIVDEIRKVANSFQIFSGVDYYISDYIFINADLRFTNFKFEGVPDSDQSFGLNFGVGFIIGKGGVVEEEVKPEL